MNSQNLQVLKVGYNSKSDAAVLSPGPGQQLKIHSITMFNGSAGTLDMAAGVRIEATILRELGASYTAFANTATPFAFFTSGGAEGMVVRAREKFDQVSFTLSQLCVGLTDWYVEYETAAGMLQLDLVGETTPVLGQPNIITFVAPHNWVANADGYYRIVIYQAGTLIGGATTDVALVQVIKHIAYRPDVGPNQQMKILFNKQPMKLESLQEIVPFFSVADFKNMVEISYQLDQ